MKKTINLIIAAAFLAACTGIANAQDAGSTPKKVAIFARNQTKKSAMDDEIDGFRDLIAAELAGSETIQLIDKADLVDSFKRYKVTTAEERAGLIEGVFKGGSAVRVAQMSGADYLMLVSVVYADKRARKLGGSNITTYSLNTSVKVLNGVTGGSVFGKTIKKKYPSNSAAGSGDDAGYYHDLMEQAATAIAEEVSASSAGWKAVKKEDAELVAFSVKTTIDDLIDGLEKGVRGKNELLDELRHVVGGATVEIDGAAVGSSPGTYKVTPGLHQIKVTRQWMKPWQKTVNIQEGTSFDVGLELSDAGIAKYKDLERLKSAIAVNYAEAAYRKNIKINFDTEAWQKVEIPDNTPGVMIQNSNR